MNYKLAVDKKISPRPEIKSLPMEACIAFAKEKATITMLMSKSTKLDTAPHLYRKCTIH